MHHIGRLVGAPAQRLRRKIRRVGLDQQPVERHFSRDIAQGFRILERHHAREGDIAAERKPAAGELGPSGEAMQHEGKGAARRLLLEDAGNVVVGVAGMDHERQAGLSRRVDVGAEAALLILARAVVVVIVEPGLADRHHLRMARKFHDFFQRDVPLFRRMVRMGADRAVHIAMRLDDLEQIGESPHPCRDGEHEPDACTLGACQHGLALCGKVWKIEMAVAIDEHHGKMKDPCSSGC